MPVSVIPIQRWQSNDPVSFRVVFNPAEPTRNGTFTVSAYRTFLGVFSLKLFAIGKFSLQDLAKQLAFQRATVVNPLSANDLIIQCYLPRFTRSTTNDAFLYGVVNDENGKYISYTQSQHFHYINKDFWSPVARSAFNCKMMNGDVYGIANDNREALKAPVPLRNLLWDEDK